MTRLLRFHLLAVLVMSLFSAALPAQRVMENLGRGVVAVRSSATEVFISWRLLGLDPATLGFNLYRSTAGGAPVKLNAAVITGATNFTDGNADLTQNLSYFVRPVLNGVEQAPSGTFTLTANHATEPIVRIPLKPVPGAGYSTKFVWVGDLDGDGEYDFVLDRLAPFDPTNNDIGLGDQYVEAYKRDGTRLWQVNLGPNSHNTYNIHPGSSTISMGMYDGVDAYDLDGDGKAEVILKIANGVKFPDGTVFKDSDDTHQYIAILNGMTGNPMAIKMFPLDFNAEGSLGTQFGVGHFKADGKPSVVGWLRNRNPDKSFNDIIVCWSWSGGTTIEETWKHLIPAGTAGIEASHQMRIMDVTGDGRDEFATGNYMLNSDGTLRYVLPGVIHGDRFHIAKMDQSRPGLQGYGIQQNNPSGLLEYYYDATTGEVLWRHSTTPGTLIDVGRGLAGDVDPGKPGWECWSFQGLYNGPTNTIASSDPALYPYPTHSIWWDGDAGTEGLNDSKIEKWDPAHPTTTKATPRLLLLSTYGAVISNHNPMFIGDIFGDWRTEVVACNADYSELMIFTTPIPTTMRLYTMAHNPEFRTGMTTKGYMQNPLLDYYMGFGMSMPAAPKIRYAGAATTSSSVTLQAESAVIAGGVLIESNHTGFNGTGFLNFPVTGGSAEFSGIDGGAGGPKTISIRYCNGISKATPRTGRLLINGAAQTITFPPTATWDTWATQNVTVTLMAGTGNIIRLESNGQDLANIDEITIP